MTPEELYESLKDLRDENSIKEIAVSFDAWIRAKYPTLESIRTAMTSYKKLVDTIPLYLEENAYTFQNSKGIQIQKHLFYKYAGLKPEEYEELNQKTREKKAERLDNRTKINVDLYLEKVGELLLSDDPHALAVGLIGATGRRPHEILVRANFKLVKSEDLSYPNYQKDSHWIMFEGQGKKRGKATPYPIATLFPASFIIRAFKRLRATSECKQLLADIEIEFPDDLIKQNDAIDSQRNTSLNRVVRAHLAGFLEIRYDRQNISCSSLRAAYARLATERDCPPEKSDLMWASKLLGHFSGDADIRALLTTAGYFDYYIDSQSVPFLDIPKIEKEKTIRSHESDFNEFVEWQKKYEISSQKEAFRKILELAKEAMRAREEKLSISQQQAQAKKIDSNLGDEMISEEKLTAMIEKIVTKKVAEALNGQSESLKAVPLTRLQTSDSQQQQQQQQQPVEENSGKDWELVPSEELKGSKAPGSAEEKIRRIIKAVMDYNDYTAVSNSERWYIGIRTIQDAAKDESGSGSIRYDSIKKFLEQYGQLVSNHNAKYGLSSQHNKRHSVSIASLICW